MQSLVCEGQKLCGQAGKEIPSTQYVSQKKNGCDKKVESGWSRITPVTQPEKGKPRSTPVGLLGQVPHRFQRFNLSIKFLLSGKNLINKIFKIVNNKLKTQTIYVLSVLVPFPLFFPVWQIKEKFWHATDHTVFGQCTLVTTRVFCHTPVDHNANDHMGLWHTPQTTRNCLRLQCI